MTRQSRTRAAARAANKNDRREMNVDMALGFSLFNDSDSEERKHDNRNAIYEAVTSYVISECQPERR